MARTGLKRTMYRILKGKKGKTEGNCDCVGYHCTLKMVKLGFGLDPSGSEARNSINIVCNISVFRQILSAFICFLY